VGAIKILDGEKLREWRETRDIPQWQVAEELGITPGFLSTVESGKRGVSIDTLDKITKLTGMKAEDLIVEAKDDSNG